MNTQKIRERCVMLGKKHQDKSDQEILANKDEIEREIIDTVLSYVSRHVKVRKSCIHGPVTSVLAIVGPSHIVESLDDVLFQLRPYEKKALKESGES